MSDLKHAQLLAVEVMRNPPPITSKISALDALDRLALNPNGWFSERILDQLTDARKAIITDYWGRALEVLEDARLAMEVFLKNLREAAENEATNERLIALARAEAELKQCVLVLSWLDTRPAR
jgi:hypothetical protein